MDLSFWSKLNPGIVYEPTRKQFYNKYCYKLVLRVPCGRVVNEKGTVLDELEHRRRLRDNRRHNYGGSWLSKFVDNIDDSDVGQLETLRSIRNGYGANIKMRVEEPWLQIYTKDEQTLLDIANRFDSSQHNRFISLSFPESSEHQKLLEQGKILVKSLDSIGYKYKVFLRDGNYSPETKQSVCNYLDNLGKDIKISPASRAMLLNQHNFVWGCFLYVNDPAVLTMVSIISPSMVGKIHELVDVSK